MADINTLLQIMEQLRDPETGCPWDKQQNFESIIPYTIEEAYEVQDAIFNSDMTALCDELGDLLLQVVYHSQMAKESGEFEFKDVVNVICEKMIRRHPHVFGDEQFESVEEIKQSWEQIKQQENGTATLSNTSQGILSQVLLTLPALKQAQKLQKKAANVGFDWDNISPVLDKVREECTEIELALQNDEEKTAIVHELGDLLFSVVNLARHLEVDAEISLLKSNRKFIRRFEFIENELSKQGKAFDDCELDELDHLWELAKQSGL